MDPGGLFGGGGSDASGGGGGVAILGGGGDPNKDEGPLDVQKAYGFAKPGADSQFNQIRKQQLGMGRTDG